VFAGNWNTDFQNAPAGSTILRGDTSTGATTGGPGGTWWFQQNMRHTNASNYWGTQVAWGWEDNANVLKTRNVQGGTFGAWVTYLNSSNYTSYIPAASVPAGAKMLFYQASAPAGWTQDTSLNDYGLRIVSGTGGTTAGTTAFSTVFANQTPTIGATTLSTAQMPSHAHGYAVFTGGGYGYTPPSDYGGLLNQDTSTGAAGGGGSHTHSMGAVTLNVRYANIIICTKN